MKKDSTGELNKEIEKHYTINDAKGVYNKITRQIINLHAMKLESKKYYENVKKAVIKNIPNADYHLIRFFDMLAMEIISLNGLKNAIIDDVARVLKKQYKSI